MIKDEIFSRLEKKSQKILYTTLIVVIIVTSVFLLVVGKFDTNPFKLYREIKSVLELKLSPRDLVTLLSPEEMPGWLNVDILSGDVDLQVRTIKIRRASPDNLNLKLNIGGTIYNLNKTGNKGKDIHSFFQKASGWGIQTSSPTLVQLKMNNVFVGIFMMEEHIYEQVRKPNGEYFIRLSTDIRLLNRIHYQVKTGKSKLLKKHFNTSRLASYFVFFSLFSQTRLLEIDRLVFRYDPVQKKYMPYLTMESIISSLNAHNTEFVVPANETSHQFRRLSINNIDNLLNRCRFSKYQKLIEMVLTEARSKIKK